MSLKTFHVGFITLSVLLAFGFGVWNLLDPSARGNAAYLTLAIVAFAAGIGLIVYEIRFLRKLKGVSFL